MNISFIKNILHETNSTTGEKNPSQGRFYLFISVMVYLIAICIMFIKSMNKNFNVDMEVIKTVISALQWSIFLFSGYSFGSKGVDAAKTMFTKVPALTQNSQTDTTTTI